MNRPANQEAATSLEDQLDDLATGQLGLRAAFRLRRRIRRESEAARLWAEISQLRADLCAAALFDNSVRIQATRRLHKTFTIGGLTMKRRTAALAAGGLMLLSVSGALAERYLVPSEAVLSFPGVDHDHEWWRFHGQFRGNIELLDSSRKEFRKMPMQGSSLQGSVHFTYSGKRNSGFSRTVSGLGEHPIIDSAGKTVAYVVLSDLTKKDIKDIADEDALDTRTFAEFYRLPERVTPSGEGRGFMAIVSVTDVVADCVTEDVSGHGVSCGHDLPISWKTYGDVHVRSRYFAPAETVPLFSQNPAKQHLTAHLSKRTIIDEGQSDAYSSAQELAKMSPADRQDFLKSYPSPYLTPVTYWTIAKPGTDVSQERGKWEHVLETGKFTGYGHFRVRDKAGRVVLVLDITRPKRHSDLTTGEGDGIDIPQRIVPGWDGEE